MAPRLLANPPPWPSGARSAVCFSYNFDAESLLHLYYTQDAARHVNTASAPRYGAVPRVVEIWRHFEIKQTKRIWAAERLPQKGRR